MILCTLHRLCDLPLDSGGSTLLPMLAMFPGVSCPGIELIKAGLLQTRCTRSMQLRNPRDSLSLYLAIKFPFHIMELNSDTHTYTPAATVNICNEPQKHTSFQLVLSWMGSVECGKMTGLASTPLVI